MRTNSKQGRPASVRARAARRHAPLTVCVLTASVLVVLLAGGGGVGASSGDAPARPSRPSVTSVTHDSVTLGWSDPDDSSITGYQVLRRPSSVDEFEVLVDDTGSAAVSYTDATVEAERTYVYRVRARNHHGLSPRSHFVSVDVPAAPLGAEARDQQGTAGEAQGVGTEDTPVVPPPSLQKIDQELETAELHHCDPSGTHDDAVVVTDCITDSELRRQLRKALGLAAGEAITVGDMKSLTSFYSYDDGIEDVAGLGFASNLTKIYLEANPVAVFDASHFPNLKGLVLMRSARLTDAGFTPPAATAPLTSLVLPGNVGISEIDVSPYVDLKLLNLGATSIAALDVSQNTKLEVLYLSGTPKLASFTGLSELRRLKRIVLQAFGTATSVNPYTIDFSNNRELEVIDLRWTHFERVTLTCLDKLSRLNIGVLGAPLYVTLVDNPFGSGIGGYVEGRLRATFETTDTLCSPAGVSDSDTRIFAQSGNQLRHQINVVRSPEHASSSLSYEIVRCCDISSTGYDARTAAFRVSSDGRIISRRNLSPADGPFWIAIKITSTTASETYSFTEDFLVFVHVPS